MHLQDGVGRTKETILGTTCFSTVRQLAVVDTMFGGSIFVYAALTCVQSTAAAGNELLEHFAHLLVSGAAESDKKPAPGPARRGGIETSVTGLAWYWFGSCGHS